MKLEKVGVLCLFVCLFSSFIGLSGKYRLKKHRLKALYSRMNSIPLA